MISLCFLLSGVGQQRDGTGALDGLGKLTLMLGAVAAHTTGQDLAALVGEAAQTVYVLVVDLFDLIHTEAAYLPTGPTASAGTRSSFATFFRHGIPSLRSSVKTAVRRFPQR